MYVLTFKVSKILRKKWSLVDKSVKLVMHVFLSVRPPIQDSHGVWWIIHLIFKV